MLFFVSLAAAGPAYDQLRSRDPVTCDDLGARSDALRDELVALTAPDVQPSLVQVRAANCLAERFGDDDTAQAAFSRWVGDPQYAGLALAVLRRADRLPPAFATALATQAVAAPHPRVAAAGQALLAEVPAASPPTAAPVGAGG
jgi:hypothetical protein